MAHFEKFKAPALGNMCDHYARVAERERGYVRDNIDNARTWRNYNLAPARGMSQVEFVNARIEALHLRRVRKDAVRMCDCVVTLPKNPELDGRGVEFFGAVYGALEKTFGEENVVSAWVHMDEARPHMHFAWVPVTRDGRLSAKDVLSRTFLKGFHGALEKAVADRMGLGRAGLSLTEDEREARGGKYVGLSEYKDALAQARRMALKRDGLRDELAAADAECGRRMDEAARAAQRAAEAERALQSVRDEQRAAEAATAAQRADLERLREETRAERERLESVQDEHRRALEALESFEAKGLGELVGLAGMRGLGERRRQAEEARGRAREAARRASGQVERARGLLEAFKERVRGLLGRLGPLARLMLGLGRERASEGPSRLLKLERIDPSTRRPSKGLARDQSRVRPALERVPGRPTRSMGRGDVGWQR